MDLKFLYVIEPYGGKIFIAGPESGSDQGKKLIVQKGLYWLKFWEVAFWSFFAENLHDTRYTTSWADQDVWLHPATSKDSIMNTF